MLQPGLIMVASWLLIVWFAFQASQCFFDLGQQGAYWTGKSGPWSLSGLMIATGSLLGLLLLIQVLATVVRRRYGWKTAVIALLCGIGVLGAGQVVLVNARNLGTAMDDRAAHAAALVLQARDLLDRGEEARAIAACEEAIALRPDDDAAWEERAWIKTYGTNPALRDPAGVFVCGAMHWNVFRALVEKRSWRAFAAAAAEMAQRGDRRAAEYQEAAISEAREARADPAMLAALEARLEGYRQEDR
jgi:hypothetical protein